MKLNELKFQDGATKKRKIVGRGIGSGKGKTCGVGQKGQKARSGVAVNGFEGGQMPLYQRLPKRGFNNIHAKKWQVVTLSRLQAAIDKKLVDAKSAIDEDVLLKAGVIKKKGDGVRVIGGGDLKAKIDLKIKGGATKSAAAAIEKAGGSLEDTTVAIAPVKRRQAK